MDEGFEWDGVGAQPWRNVGARLEGDGATPVTSTSGLIIMAGYIRYQVRAVVGMRK